MHERFWADDLVYVSAKGEVRSKANILESMRAGDTPGVRDSPAALWNCHRGRADV